jgi:hypothetical protein
MTRIASISLTLLALLSSAPALAGGGPSKAGAARFSDELQAACPDGAWALKDLPARSGMTMMSSWLAPVPEVSPAGFKIETWNPRQNDGMRMGYGAPVTMTGYPGEIRFEGGKLVGLATGSGGGVSLD